MEHGSANRGFCRSAMIATDARRTSAIVRLGVCTSRFKRPHPVTPLDPDFIEMLRSQGELD
jgi:hypothetical protein